MKSFRFAALGAALCLSFAMSAYAQFDEASQEQQGIVEQNQSFDEQEIAVDNSSTVTAIDHRGHDRGRNRGGWDRGRDRDRDRGGWDRGRDRDRDRWDRGHGRDRYEWVFEYVDGSGRCRSCSASCGQRCDAYNLGAKMACYRGGTHNDLNVFRCSRVGGW